MESNKRKIFLEAYLRIFGAQDIKWTEFENSKICGTVIYDENDPEEQQDFCWHMNEENVPSNKAIEFINILLKHNYMNGDKLIVSLDEVFKKTNEKDFEQFELVMDELFNVGVDMVDDGVESDCFYIHN